MNLDDIYKKAKDLDVMSKDYTLSHAVFATANMIENTYMVSKKADDDEMFLNYFKKFEGDLNKINQHVINERMNSENIKVYITVGRLSSNSMTEAARTYVYKNKVCHEKYDNCEKSCKENPCKNNLFIQRFEIILPPKDNDTPVLKRDGEKPVKKSMRFLVGHELGHLWLHLEDVKKLVNMTGTNALPDYTEHEANVFSIELSRLRDINIRETLKL